jgi:hypothetical protein
MSDFSVQLLLDTETVTIRDAGEFNQELYAHWLANYT